MNETKNENGNSEIPKVEELVIEDGDDAETIKSKTEAWKAKVDENNKQLYARTKKAEGFELIDGKWVKTNKSEKKEEKPDDTTTRSSKDSLSQSDLIAVINAKIPEEDLSEVVEYAQLKGISVADALKSTVVKTILATKEEERRVADGTNTEGGKRGSSKLSDEALLSNASKGIMPENDDDMKRLVALQIKARASR